MDIFLIKIIGAKLGKQ